ncbi:MAG: hypothetical protein AAF560_10250 [Acidobacteriota bacterium]
MKTKCLSIAAICLLAGLPVVAQESVLARIDRLEPGDVEVRGFELDSTRNVTIEAWGLNPDRRYEHKAFSLASAWILDARSREVVWDLKDAKPVRRQRDLRRFEQGLRLGPGIYEVYYATFPTERYDEYGDWLESTARAVGRMFGWDDDKQYLKVIDELEIVVRGTGRSVDQKRLEKAREALREEALVAAVASDDSVTKSYGFLVKEPTEVLVYAVGELSAGDEGYDYGWITNAKTRERVWRMTWDNSDRAGGAKKNRVAHDVVTLPPGKYVAHFVTDDSHSPQRWNALPPRDPAFWGMTLWLKNPDQMARVERFDYQYLPTEGHAIVELTRLRDDEHVSEGFTLSKAADVRIYAVGEGFPRDMADYGWIVDARTRKKVWAMDYERTVHAGGGSKNRVADEVLRLEPGSYIVSFVTDGSHAYRDWNTSPPSRPERWGITVFGTEDFDPSVVAAYREEEDPNVLARIARVKSDSHRRREFMLTGDAEVSVYALGEGTHGEMYDYAWIENSDGKVIWEMTYRMTDGAGGASKNRLFQGTLMLRPGQYVLHYRTDDSHAYRDWNATPPHDPDAWGVQIALVE